VIGLLLLIPATRAIFRGLVARMASRRATFAVRAVRWGYGAGRDRPPRARRPGHYDYEGDAREVTDPRGELPRHQDDARP
jgi:UPF0716 family protein affecting phage T7 exclusion